MERFLKILIIVGLILIIEIGGVIFLLIDNKKELSNNIALQPQTSKRYELIAGDIPYTFGDRKEATVYLSDNQSGEVWVYNLIGNVGWKFIKAEKHLFSNQLPKSK